MTSKPKPNQKRLALRPNYRLVLELQALGYQKIVGLDEVGRGALAGPVIVAAVELPNKVDGITDSKLINKANREIFAAKIHEQSRQLNFGIGSVEEINRLGIVRALELAYERALETSEADLFLTDYWRLPGRKFISQPHGDQYFYPTAAASIVAKVYRDEVMQKLHAAFPIYGWGTNVGYGTAEHLAALKTHGPSVQHRKSFLPD